MIICGGVFVLKRMLLIVGLAVAANSHAAEISVVSGLYKSEKKKVAGEKTGSNSTFGLGARYAESLGDNYFWFGDGKLTIRSYDEAADFEAPAGSTSLDLGGGLRYDLADYSKIVVPHLLGRMSFLNEKTGEISAPNAIESEKNGLFYEAAVGLRLDLSSDFYIDLDCQLFKSALFSTVSSQGSDGTKTETTHFDLFVDTEGDLGDTTVSMGWKF
jgi:hypothetical protein